MTQSYDDLLTVSDTVCRDFVGSQVRTSGFRAGDSALLRGHTLVTVSDTRTGLFEP